MLSTSLIVARCAIRGFFITGDVTITRKNVVKFGVGFLVSALCLLIAVWGIPFEDVIASFKRADYSAAPLLLGALVVFFWIKAIRWTYLLEPVKRLKTREVVPAMMIGFMGNNVLPAHLGEFIRVYVLGRQFSLSKMSVLSTVVLERVLDVAAILVLFATGLFLAQGVPESYRTFCEWAAVGTVVGLLMLAAYVVWTGPIVRCFEALLNRLSFVPEGLRGRLTELLELGATGLASLKKPRLLFGSAVTSVLHWLCNVALVYLALCSFGIHKQVASPVLVSFVVLGVTAFGVTVPSTPGFFGVIQVCFWLSLSPFGASKADAFAASVYYHMIWYVPVTLVGFFYLNRLGLHLSDVSHDSEEESDAMDNASPPESSDSTPEPSEAN